MREKKHSKISMLVVAVAAVLLFGFFMLTTPQAFAAQGNKGNGQHKQRQNQQKQGQNHQKQGQKRQEQGQKHQKQGQNYQEQGQKHQKQGQNHQEKNTHARPDYRGRPDYDKYRGYREHPYDKRRRYAYKDFKGHRYDYRGHWRSWHQWDRYRKAHPEIFRHGMYYREHAHLMFRFCEPGTGCFFFSIGR